MIFADMEGVAGIQAWEQTGGAGPRYEEGRRLYTGEVSACVRGCLRAGAAPVVAADGHGGAHDGGRGFMSWVPEMLEQGAEYVMGRRWATYVEPLETGECGVVLLVGAHARAGVQSAALCHTVSGSWHRVQVNGREIGESGIVAGIAGSFGVPVAFVAGDQASCDELAELVGSSLVTAPVKAALDRYAARTLAPPDARALIETRAAQALALRDNWPRPWRPEPPVLIDVELTTPDAAGDLAQRAGVERTGPRCVCVTASSFWEAWRRLWPAVA